MYKNLIIALVSIFIMMGCNEKSTYTYLMQHRHELEQAMENCQTSINQKDDAYCRMVEHAVENFNKLVTEQQSNPELFGQQILDQEIVCAKVKQDKNANADQVAKDCDEVKAMLAVVGLTSPE